MARRLGVCGACGGVSDWHRFYDFLRFTLVETHSMHKPEKIKSTHAWKTGIPKKKKKRKACQWHTTFLTSVMQAQSSQKGSF